MNGTFNAFPTAGREVINRVEYDSSGTYVIPQGTVFLYTFIIGGGGGGGGGARRATGVESAGAAGASGGGYWHGLIFAPEIGGAGTSLNITLGSGGTAGAAATGDSLAGGAGGNGGSSTISIAGMQGYLIKVTGGLGTSGITSTGFNSCSMGHRTTRTNAGTGSGATGTNRAYRFHNDSGGTGGGGVSTANVAGIGGGITYYSYANTGAVTNPNLNLTAFYPDTFVTTFYAYPQTATGSNGIDSSFHCFDAFSPGLGGTGGGGGLTGGGRGGNGYRGSGGGGGGGTRNGFAAGAGGRGGNGYCIIMALR
jgi:hypothetical protein